MLPSSQEYYFLKVTLMKLKEECLFKKMCIVHEKIGLGLTILKQKIQYVKTQICLYLINKYISMGNIHDR